MTKKEKIRKDIKVTAAWIDHKKLSLECIGIVEDIEIRFTAAKVGYKDKNGRMVTIDDLNALFLSAQERIKKGVS